ncbi:MAG: hypothetical protein RLZZ77_1514 [Bacteroidota bacterium]|jgi:hypothetical protein
MSTSSTTSSAVRSAWSISDQVSWLLRFGMLGCFVGHGIWGLLHKPGWLPFFEIYFIPKHIAYQLMPFVGIMDILIGVVAFFKPNRTILIWAAFWTLFTALLRPCAGMGMSEFFERGGNYGLPLALLYIVGWPKTTKDWFSALSFQSIEHKITHPHFEKIARLCLVMLLAGHGGLAFFVQSPLLEKHLSFLGLSLPNQLQWFGLFEMALAVFVWFRSRTPYLMFFIVAFKLFSESLHPIVGDTRDVLETIERMGDYILPLVLWTLYKNEQ